MPRPRVWALSLWTAGRVPSLVDFGAGRIGPSLLGRLVLERWEQMASTFPEIALDEYAILPDRFRALVHAAVAAQIELALAWFRAAVAHEARLARLSTSGVLWEMGADLAAVENLDEWISWRRRIRAGRALGLSGRLPEPGAGYAVLSGNGTSRLRPSRAIRTEGNSEDASASSSGASRL